MISDIDKWALDCCDLLSTRSKDPSRKVGALILRSDNSIASAGYNGFPRGVDDSLEIYENKTRRLNRVVHAELNAIIASKQSLLDCTLYVSPLFTCSNCASCIIQAGIRRVVSRINTQYGLSWKESFEEAKNLYNESGVIVDIEEI